MTKANLLETERDSVRANWTREEVTEIYHQPILDLLFQAQQVHRKFHPANQVQICRLLPSRPVDALKIAAIVRRARTITPELNGNSFWIRKRFLRQPRPPKQMAQPA